MPQIWTNRTLNALINIREETNEVNFIIFFLYNVDNVVLNYL
jgi:hypothetical protein